METIYVDDCRGSGAKFDKTRTQGEVLHVGYSAATVYVLKSSVGCFRSLEGRSPTCWDNSSAATRPMNCCCCEGDVVGHIRSLPKLGTYVMGKMTLKIIFFVLEQEPRYQGPRIMTPEQRTTLTSDIARLIE